MTWTAWRTHFDANFTRPLPEAAPPPLDGQAQQALARTLALFQRGETGEGRLAHEIDGVQLPGVDADYRHCLKRAVAEEGRHARILARMVQGLGGTLVQSNWTEALFRRARRLLGVRFKLVVVLVAEVVGGAFYGLLARALPDSALRCALEELCADEAAHLRFHRQFLQLQAHRPLAFALLRAAYWPIASLAIAVVLGHHGATLAHFGITRREALGVLGAAVHRSALAPVARRVAASAAQASR
jgi:hypothetical protein